MKKLREIFVPILLTEYRNIDTKYSNSVHVRSANDSKYLSSGKQEEDTILRNTKHAQRVRYLRYPKTRTQRPLPFGFRLTTFLCDDPTFPRDTGLNSLRRSRATAATSAFRNSRRLRFLENFSQNFPSRETYVCSVYRNVDSKSRRCRRDKVFLNVPRPRPSFQQIDSNV